jgi:3-oxoacyl-[acyl-carrier protein] reductase
VDTDMVRVPRYEEGEVQLHGPEMEARIEAQLEALRELHLLKQLGTPEDIAEAVLYLIDAPFVTGTVLTVDGGLLAGGN